jgi:glyoxylase-like metal-dependent hydrolase (beta-lactamase superfamily II)
MSTRVIQLALSISNAYLLIGRHPVLVDAGAPGDDERLLGALRAHDVAPEDLALIVLPHGHTDHTGSVNAVAAGEAPVAIGAGDVRLLEAGANGVLPAIGPAGTALAVHRSRRTAERHRCTPAFRRHRAPAIRRSTITTELTESRTIEKPVTPIDPR